MTRDVFASEEIEIVATVQRFVEREVRPVVARLERDGVYPDGLVATMRALGLFGMAVPQEHGGLGLRVPVLARVMEELAKGWTTLAAYVNSHSTLAHAIARHGTRAQQAQYLPLLASGEMRGALCLTEPQAGSDLQAIATKADVEDGGYVVSGNKIYVTNGAKASLLLVLAKTDRGAEKPSRGMSLFLIPKPHPGVATGGTFHKMAFAQVDTVEIILDRARLPVEALLGGRPGAGFAQLMEALEVGRIAIAASAVGLAAAALGAAMRFAEERRAFGKPINEHQAIQLRLAEMASRLVAAREVTRLAAEAKQNGGRCDMLSAMAKLVASEACLGITEDAIRVHGGHGYITESQVERLHREALVYIVGEGTNDIQKLVIARRLLEGSEASLLGLP